MWRRLCNIDASTSGHDMEDASVAWREAGRLAYLYRGLSDIESGSPRQLVFLELAQDADARVAYYESQFKLQLGEGDFLPPYHPGMVTRSVLVLARAVGPGYLTWILAGLGVQGLSVYHRLYPDVSALLQQGDVTIPLLPEHLRRAVYATHEGLLAMMTMVMLMAGASVDHGHMLVAGAVLLAIGALAMALVEFYQSRSRSDVAAYSLSNSLGLNPAWLPMAELRMLVRIYEARGKPTDEAQQEALRVMTDPFLGIDPNELPLDLLPTAQLLDVRQVVVFIFFAFVLGGIVPLLPYILELHPYPELVSGLISFACLFVTGGGLGLLKRRRVLWSGLCAQGWGLVLGASAYWMGRWLI